jgi:putative ATP-binding cassette transporter
MEQSNFNLTEVQLFTRYLKGASGFWRGRTGWYAWSLFFLLIALILLQLLVSYYVNFWNRDFFNALSKKDVAQLWKEAWIFVPLLLSSIFIAVLNVWAKMTAQRKWREWLSDHMIHYWVKDNHYFGLTSMKNHPRNAEYRIAEDARVATDLPYEMVLGFISSVLTAITFITVLWQVGGTMDLKAFGTTISIPGYLVLVALAYSAVFTSSTVFFARHLTRAVEEKNNCEAEFRSAASNLRQHGEGENPLEYKDADTKAVNTALSRVIDSWRILCLQLMRTTFVATGNGVLAPVVGLLVCAPKYLSSGMSIGQVVQAAAAFVTVQSCFNWLLNNYPSIADWLSSSNRVALLLFALDELEAKKTA